MSYYDPDLAIAKVPEGASRDIKRAILNAWFDGLRSGITAHAVCRDGQQLVGSLERPLAEVIENTKQRQEKLWMQM